MRLLIFFVCVQVRGHQRGASTDTREFHEVTKRDALIHFDQELNTLLATVQNDEERSQYGKEMKRFSALFGRFLQEEGPSVEWDRIQKLPNDAVKDYATLSTPTKEDTVNDGNACTEAVSRGISEEKAIAYTFPSIFCSAQIRFANT